MRANRLAFLVLTAAVAACSTGSPAGPAEEAPRVPAGVHRNTAPPDTTTPTDTTDTRQSGYLGSGHRGPPPQNSEPQSGSKPRP